MLVATPFSSHREASRNEASIVAWTSLFHPAVFQLLTLARPESRQRSPQTERSVAPTIRLDVASASGRLTIRFQMRIGTRNIAFEDPSSWGGLLLAQVDANDLTPLMPKLPTDNEPGVTIQVSLFRMK